VGVRSVRPFVCELGNRRPIAYRGLIVVRRDGLLSERDRRILTSAIRDALRPEPQRPAPRIPVGRAAARVGAQLVIGLTLATLAWAFLGWLLTTHVPKSMSANSSTPDGVSHISINGLRAVGAGWSMSDLVTDGVTIVGPTANLDIALPLDRCPKVRRTLGLTCTDGSLEGVRSPLSLSFDEPVTAQVIATGVANVDLDRLGSSEGFGKKAFGLVSTGGSASVTFDVSTALRLRVSSAGESLPPLLLRPGAGVLTSDVLHVPVEFGSGRTPETNIIWENVSAIGDLDARGTSGELQGFGGKVVLQAEPSNVVDPSSTLSVGGDKTHPVIATFSIGTARPVAQLTSTRASTVRADDEELLPSRWADRPQFWGPVLTAIMGTLVLELTVGQVGTSIKALLDRIGGTG
jgi:hypothetical protein